MGRVPTVYYCSFENCGAKFSRLNRLENHQRIHTGERPFVCEFDGCKKSYARLAHLKRHEEVHQSSFSCSVEGCNEVLKTRAYLKKHLNVCHEKKKHKIYKCSICDQEFNKHNWLQRHMFRHTGELPHVCPVKDCDRAFLMPSLLKRHMKYHKGYPCNKPNCDQVFSKWSVLVDHIKKCHPSVHTCQVCKKEFSSAGSLQQHSLVHQEEREVFECQVPNCSRFYTMRKNLVHHMRHYHDKRPYVCKRDHCYKAFTTEEWLAYHIRRHHEGRAPKNKKKKPKPTFAEKLSGVAPPKVINRKRRLSLDSPQPTKGKKLQSDYVTVTVTMSSDGEVCVSDGNEKSCLAIFEDILNGTHLPVEDDVIELEL